MKLDSHQSGMTYRKILHISNPILSQINDQQTDSPRRRKVSLQISPSYDTESFILLSTDDDYENPVSSLFHQNSPQNQTKLLTNSDNSWD